MQLGGQARWTWFARIDVDVCCPVLLVHVFANASDSPARWIVS